MASNAKSLPVVLLTGSSTGIGLALAQMLNRDERYRVVITARKRSLSRLDPTIFQETNRVHLRPLDITLSNERKNLLTEIEENWGGVDYLINNAGVAYRAVFEHMTESDFEKQMDTNFLAPMALIREALPLMRQKRKGRIINISSLGGMMAMPTMSAYSASKFALEGASESLWYEMKPWGIHVSLIQPGFIYSESFKNTLYSDISELASNDSKNPYHFYYKNMESFIAKAMNRALATPESIAKIVLKTMAKKNPALRIPATFDAWFFGLLRKFLPRGLYHRFLFANLPGIKNWVNVDAKDLRALPQPSFQEIRDQISPQSQSSEPEKTKTDSNPS